MNPKTIIGGVIVIVFLVIGALSFIDSNVEYCDFTKAEQTGKKVQVKGSWMKDKKSNFDLQRNEFTFIMKDEKERELPVILTGPKPNNFDIAVSLVAKGRYRDGKFLASEILTKCPSKYAADSLKVPS